MFDLKVYNGEREDGLTNLIKANHSISYLVQAKPSDLPSQALIAKAFQKSTAAKRDQIDLFYFDGILCTSTWNKNDDVFVKGEMWKARHTPVDKMLNLNHDHTKVVGHITSCFALDSDYGFIDDVTAEADLPDIFHLVTGAVVYRLWETAEQRQEIETVIADIKEGKKFLSMECFFPDFDYALWSEGGEKKIIERTEASSFLTKKLRAYGGEGKYGDYKIGRLLKNFVFSGKGIVDKPANPESIIFTTEAALESFSKNLGYINLTSENKFEIGETVMASEITDMVTISKAELSELKAKADEAGKATIKSLQDKLATAESEKEKAMKEKEKAEADSKKDKEDKEKAEAEVAKAKADKEKAEKERDDAKAELDAEKKTKEEYEKAGKVKAALGYDDEKAKAFIKEFEGLTAAQFDKVIELAKSEKDDNGGEKSKKKAVEEKNVKGDKSETVVKAKKSKEDDDDDEDDDEKAVAAATDVETSEKNVSLAKMQEVQTTKAQLSDFLGQVIASNKKNRNKSNKEK